MHPRKLIALSALAFVVVAVVGLRSFRRDLQPTGLRVGDRVPAALVRYAGPTAERRHAHLVDAVFVARSCTACHALVASLLAGNPATHPDHAIVFVTDATWPALDSLATQRANDITVARLTDALPHAIGLRATPTLVSYDAHARTAAQVLVGVTAIANALVAGH